MSIASVIKRNLYKDSVALMRLAADAQQHSGVRHISLVMGTPANKAILAEAGLLTADAEAASANDLVIAMQGDAPAIAAAQTAIEEALASSATQAHATESAVPVTSIQQAMQRVSAKLAMISVPGPYAAAEAMKALKQGLHVFLFSDNVPIEEEVALKQLARQRGLLVMGPDCGTAVVDGVPLGFANRVRRGSIGFVAASGTGLQEVTTHVHRLGAGVSHAFGTGGRDLSQAVGGITTLQALELLAQDEATRVIGMVSKPPSPQVAEYMFAALVRTGKPSVVCFLGGNYMSPHASIRVTSTLRECAAQAAALAGYAPAAQTASMPVKPAYAASQRDIRALYSGGTFCYEAQAIWRKAGLQVRSNTPIDDSDALSGSAFHHQGHTAIDFGDDSFTVGRPHPMIDPSYRLARLQEEARDPRTAVIVLDVVLGFGAHPDPAGVLAPAIREAQATARAAGRTLAIVAFVCGTDEDPQRHQAEALLEAGAVVCSGSTHAAEITLRLLPAAT